MSLKNQAISGVKWTSLSAVIIAVLRLTQVTVLARFLSPTDFGLMAMALIVIDIVLANLDLGVSAGIIHYQDASQNELSSLYWMNVFTGIIIFFCFFISKFLVAGFFDEPRLTGILVWVSVSFLIVPFGSQFKVLMQRDLKFNLLAKQEITGKLCEAAVAITLAITGYGVWALVIGYLVGMVVNTTLVIIIGIKHYRPNFHCRWHELKKYLSFGLYQMGTRTIGLFSDKLDQILIGSLLSTQDLGYYSFAYNISNQPITRIAPVLMRVLFPIFSKAQNDIETLKKAYLKVIKSMMYVVTPLAVGLAVFASDWIIPVFGEKWEGSIILIQILSILAIFKGPGKTYGSLILSQGKPEKLFNWSVFSVLFRFFMLYIGGKLYGVIGLASFLVIFQSITIVPGYFYFIRTSIGSCFKEYSIAILKPVSIGIIMALGILSIIHFGRFSIAYLVIEIFTGTAIYLSLLYLLDRSFTLDLKDIIIRS